MNKLMSILLSTLLCASLVVFSPNIQCYADGNDGQSDDPSIVETPMPCVDEHGSDDF